MCRITPAKSNLTVFEAQQSTVGDGDAVSVVSQVLKDMPRGRKGLLGVDNPVFIFERPGKSIESSALLKGRQRSAEWELAETKRAGEERGTFPGTSRLRLSLEGRTLDSGSESSVSDRRRCRRPAPGSGCADEPAISDSRCAGPPESQGVPPDAADPQQS